MILCNLLDCFYTSAYKPNWGLVPFVAQFYRIGAWGVIFHACWNIWTESSASWQPSCHIGQLLSFQWIVWYTKDLHALFFSWLHNTADRYSLMGNVILLRLPAYVKCIPCPPVSSSASNFVLSELSYLSYQMVSNTFFYLITAPAPIGCSAWNAPFLA